MLLPRSEVSGAASVDTDVLMSKIDQTLRKGAASKPEPLAREEQKQPVSLPRPQVSFEQALVVSECIQQPRSSPRFDPSVYEADIQKYIEAEAQNQLELKLQELLLAKLSSMNLE